MLTKIRVSKKNIRKFKGKTSDISYDGVPGGIRTHDPLLRRQPLYPTELQGRTRSLTYDINLYQQCKPEWADAAKPWPASVNQAPWLEAV